MSDRVEEVAIAAAPNEKSVAQELTAFLRRGWLVSPQWDLFWLLSGLFALPVIGLLYLLGQNSAIDRFYLIVALTIAGAHWISPMAVAWSSPGLRKVALVNRRRFIYLPLAGLLIPTVLGLSAGLLPVQWPGLLHLAHPWMLVFILQITFDIQHFCGQNFGVLSIYRKTAGLSSAEDRSMDQLYCRAINWVLMPLAWLSQGVIWGPILGYVPRAEAHGPVVMGVCAVTSLATVLMIVRDIRTGNSSLPRILYIFTLGMSVVLTAYSATLYGLFVFALWHWITAIGLGARVRHGTLQQMAAGKTGWYAKLRAKFATEPLYLMIVGAPMIATVSVVLPLLLWGAPLDALVQQNKVASTLGIGLLAGIVTGLGFVHLFYDRAIYQFRHEEVRKFVAPHLFAQPGSG
jgi:hypothetical protein